MPPDEKAICILTLKGSKSWGGTPSGCESLMIGSGGLRYRFDPRLLSGNPPGCEPG